MRYLVVFLLALALVAPPRGLSAQEGEDGAEPPTVGTQPARQTQPTQSWLERIHPEAFEAPAKKPDSGIEIGYVPASSQPHTEEGRRRGISKGGKIAIAVLVPVMVVSVGLGVGFAVSLNRNPLFE